MKAWLREETFKNIFKNTVCINYLNNLIISMSNQNLGIAATGAIRFGDINRKFVDDHIRTKLLLMSRTHILVTIAAYRPCSQIYSSCRFSLALLYQRPVNIERVT